MFWKKSSENEADMLVTPPSLPDDWREWVATNLMMGAPAEDLSRVLQKRGFSEEMAQKELEEALSHPYIRSGTLIQERLKKRDWVLNCQSKLMRMSANYGTIDQHYKLSRKNFFEYYYFANRPVLIKGMLEDWPALTRWTPDYLKEKCGKQIVEVQFGRSNDANYEINQTQYKRQMPFSEYIDLVHGTSESNDFYMTANNSGMNAEALQALWPDVPPLTEYISDDQGRTPGFFWYGPKGTVTPAHHDLTNNFMAQVRGSKLVKLVPPSCLPDIYNYRHCYSKVDLGNIDYEQFPDFNNIQVIDVVLEAGDILFLPVGYWHYVKGLDISITMTYTNFIVSNDFSSFYDTYQFFE